MFLKITGKPSKIDRKTIKAAVAFYADYLMDDHNDIDLVLDFEKNYKKFQGNYADCVNEDDLEFTITVDADLGKRSALLAIAHEMVHVKQWATGELDYNERKQCHRFNKKNYSEDMNYWDRPWEIEAFGRELGLYNMFMDSQKKVK